MDICTQFGRDKGIKERLQQPIIEQMLNAMQQPSDPECLELAKCTFESIQALS